MEAIVNTEQGRVRGTAEKGGVVSLGSPTPRPRSVKVGCAAAAAGALRGHS